MLNLATMATTSHGLSVYINTCVKNPHVSKARASGTYPRGTLKQATLFATDPGPVRDEREEFEGGEVNGLETAPVRASQEDLEEQLRVLSEEQFYLKLQQLKESNRKTLEECAKLYQEKNGSKGRPISDLSARDMVDNMFAARLAARSGLVDKTPQQDDYGLTGGYDKKIALASKPPPVPAGKRVELLSKTSPARISTATPSRSHGILRARPSSAPTNSDEYVRRSYSLDEQDWRKTMQASFDSDEVQSEGPLDPKSEAAFNKIQTMWRGFKIDDYSPRYRRRSTSSMASKQQKGTPDPQDGWRHRITIPKPFEMSVRDSARQKSKTKAQLDLEEKRLEKQRLEEEECQKKFKAQPAPAHIYLPLYDEIREKKESRRQFVKQNCKEMLKSLEKPFNFVKREEEKKQQRMVKMSVAERLAKSVQKKNEKQFVAKPVPKAVFSREPTERLQEEEFYRKIRMKVRSKELLHSSALPPNMAMQQKLKEQKEREKLMKAKSQQKKRSNKPRPRSAHTVPDYDEMYRDFQKELARRKEYKEATVVEPFSFASNHRRSACDRALRASQEHELADTSPHRPRLDLGYISQSMDSIPIKATASSELRKEYFRTLRQQELRRAEDMAEEERRRQMREAKLRKNIRVVGADTPRVEQVLRERYKQHKSSDKARLEQYERELAEIKSRVEQRPLLVQKESQHSAGKAAEKKFQSTMRSAGIDDEFLREHSSRAPASGDDGKYDNYEDDYEEEN